MAWTQAQRDALAAQIARGILTVRYDGREVTYQSTQQMMALLREIDAELAGVLSGRVGTVYSTFTRE